MALRRWFRFRLRTLLIVATLLCIALAFIVVPARRHRQAVLELRARGYGVGYCGELHYSTDYDKWFQRKLGCDFGCNVCWIADWGTVPTERDWYLIEMCQPYSITVQGLSPDDLSQHSLAQHLLRLRKLERLEFDQAAIPARELKQLRAHPSITAMELLNDDLDDDRIEQIAAFTQLRDLKLSGERIAVVSLPKFATLRNLQTLSLRFENLTTNDIQHLKAALPQCEIEWDEWREKPANEGSQ